MVCVNSLKVQLVKNYPRSDIKKPEASKNRTFCGMI